MTDIYINNGKIAKFMGAKHYFKDSHKSMYRFPDRDYRHRDLRYHASWNLLMPVAKKIIEEYYCIINIDDLIRAGGRFDMEEIYTEVAESIKEIEEL